MANKLIYLAQHATDAGAYKSHLLSAEAVQHMIDDFDSKEENRYVALCDKRLLDRQTNTMVGVLVNGEFWLKGGPLVDMNTEFMCAACHAKVKTLL